jgi:hypothetical protein
LNVTPRNLFYYNTTKIPKLLTKYTEMFHENKVRERRRLDKLGFELSSSNTKYMPDLHA